MRSLMFFQGRGVGVDPLYGRVMRLRYLRIALVTLCFFVWGLRSSAGFVGLSGDFLWGAVRRPFVSSTIYEYRGNDAPWSRGINNACAV